MEILSTFFQGSDAISIASLILAGVITVLMAVIGHFLKQANQQLKELSTAIVGLQITLGKEQQNLIHLKAQCDTHSKKVDGEIVDLDKRIDNHELRISILEEHKK